MNHTEEIERPRAFHIMTKPVGPICNLDCRYCFYLEKENLFPADHSFRMTDEVLERYIESYIREQKSDEIAFAWQGGEPTLLGVDFFRKAVRLQARYAGGKRISNAFQTNGTLLNDAWGEFLHENGFLVGISIDGPSALHDAYRVDKRGRPSFDRVMAGLEILKKHKVEFNTLTVVNRKNSQHPLDVYRFLKSIGSDFIQFIPLVERHPSHDAKSRGFDLSLPPGAQDEEPTTVTAWSVYAKSYGEFLVAIYDEWVRRDVGRVFVQLFDVALGNWMGMGSSLCVFAETCGSALAMEHNGNLYACDHYVYPEYHLGNLMDQRLGEMVHSPQQRAFGQAKKNTLPKYCRACSVRFACNGECPKHRFMKTPDGEPGLNYLCPAYKRFFTHIDPTMRVMVSLLRSNRPASEIMDWVAEKDLRRQWETVQRNDPCPCGSGKRLKACCATRRA